VVTVVLSITRTLCSTLLAVVAMSALAWLYLGERIPVPVEKGDEKRDGGIYF